MQNITVLWLLMTGTTAAASSEVHPITRSRLCVRLSRLPTAGTASAGSPLVSAEVQLTLWPRMPPALLMALTVPSHDTRYVGPSAASGPLNGATSAKTIGPELLPPDDVLPQAARPAASAVAAPIARARPARLKVVSDLPASLVILRRLHCGLVKSPLCESSARASEADVGRARRPPFPAAEVGLLGYDAVADRADALDGDLDDVAWLQPYRRLPREADAAGRPGSDHVTGPEEGERGKELDRAGDIDDHLGGACRLHDLAVQRRREGGVGHVGLIGGDEFGADRHRALEVLASGPLRRRPLPVTRRGVIEHDVAGDRVECLIGVDVPAAGPDDQAELALVVEPARQRGLHQVGVGPERAALTADERLRPGRHLAAALDGVLPVVHAEAQDPARLRHRRAELGRAERRSVAVEQTADGLDGPRLEDGPQRCQLRIAKAVGYVHVAGARPRMQAQSARRDQGGKPHGRTSGDPVGANGHIG